MRLKSNKKKFEDKVLEWADRIFNSRIINAIHIAVMVFAVLYFGAHIVWWWIRNH